MRKTFLRLACISGALAVGIGAFGAHSLKEIVTAEKLAIYETGVRYHFYHTFALLAVGILMHFKKNKAINYAGWAFLAGIVLFSGSLYLLAVNESMHLGLAWLGPITPIGGVLFIIGWIALIYSSYQKNER